jgi:predicted ATP-dependent serine protease
MAKTAWRCSQCGTVNEPDARACQSCGKWQSLFDLQDSAVPDEQVEPATFEVEEARPAVFETEPFEPEVFDEEATEAEEGGRRRRFPSWAVTAIWVIGVLVWLLVNAFSDR